MCHHRREVTVIVQQTVAMLDTECRYHKVRRFADRDPDAPQPAIVARDAGSKVAIQERYNDVIAQRTLDPYGMRLVPCPLEDFEQDEVADQKRFPTRGGLQLRRGRRLEPTQMGNPHGAVDEDHEPRSGRP